MFFMRKNPEYIMHRRIVGVFCLLAIIMTGMIARLYAINASDVLSAAAQAQGRYGLTVAETRGTIYDRNRQRLVNQTFRYVASVMPTPEAATALLEDAGEAERGSLMARLTGGKPFALTVEDSGIYARGVEVFRVVERYGEQQYAPHLIGYLGDGNVGVAGLERAYDGLLAEAGGEVSISYQMDATGRMMNNTVLARDRSGEDPAGGIVLTLDRDIQEVVQQALLRGCTHGAAVVMDVHSGDILGMASLPVFDQNDIAASLTRDDAPFVNRAVSGYNIGSVFKLLVSACALEEGAAGYQHDCQGMVDIAGQVFRCNNDRVHGLCDMQRALEVSCNCYFICLARDVFPPETLLAFVRNLGLGAAAELAPGMSTQAGNLPTAEELSTPAGYANFSFGQGSSLASPLQIAQAVSAIANGGKSVTPRLVLGTTADGLNIAETTVYASNSVLSERSASRLREMMAAVVEQGSGKPATPEIGGAGGKTSSAQTGQMDEDTGEEIVHAWFAGFYPVQEPEYAIAVFVEGGESGEDAAAPIFKQIADGIAFLR